VRIRLPEGKGTKVLRVVATVGGKTVGRARHAALTVRLPRTTKRTVTVRLHVTLRTGGRTRHVTLSKRYRAC
jgi:hypothetical protein